MHQEHIRMVKNDRNKKIINMMMMAAGAADSDEQKSMASYIWAAKFAKVCKDLEAIRGKAIEGCGKVKVEGQRLKGEINDIG